LLSTLIGGALSGPSLPDFFAALLNRARPGSVASLYGRPPPRNIRGAARAGGPGADNCDRGPPGRENQRKRTRGAPICRR